MTCNIIFHIIYTSERKIFLGVCTMTKEIDRTQKSENSGEDKSIIYLYRTLAENEREAEHPVEH